MKVALPSNAPPSPEPRLGIPSQTVLLAALLACAVLAAFWPVIGNEFVRYDDGDYVTANPHVLRGLSWQSFLWAFGVNGASNWHPLTWLSHMLDVQLFGLGPAGHHFTSLLLHTANTLLLFSLFKRLTGAVWKSFFLAALFGLHPLHVESVAWIAERKDVLSTCFFLLTLLSYSTYVARVNSHDPKSKSAFRLAMLLFAFGLMSKPMIVTLPFVLLLLDFWPLKRFQISDLRGPRPAIIALLREKVPFFCLAAVACVITLVVQGNAHAMDLRLPFSRRAANAVVAYVKYLANTFWPADLAVYYPHPDSTWPLSTQWPGWQIAVAALGLLGVSIWAALQLKRWPWLALGWFWFLGTLVPVIGLVQVGGQAMADRYTYIPLIGLFVAVIWSAAAMCAARRSWLNLAAACGCFAIAACALATHAQARYWRTTFTLFEHAVAVTRNNAYAHYLLGTAFGAADQFEPALEHYQLALSISPSMAEAHYGRGTILEAGGKPDDALLEYQTAVKLQPWYADAHKRLAALFWLAGRQPEALRHCEEAVRLHPQDVQARINLGGMLWALGRRKEALTHYAAAVRSDPWHPVARYNLALALSSEGRLAEAAPEFAAAIRLDPSYFEASFELGRTLAGLGRLAEALKEFQAASRLNPTNPGPYVEIGKALFLAGETNQAAASFAKAESLEPNLAQDLLENGKSLMRERRFGAAANSFSTALRIHRDWPEALTLLAWVRATAPDAEVRDGFQALKLAERARDLTGGNEPHSWAALDAAYAESGRFAEALAATKKARDLAQAAGDTNSARAAEARAANYRQQKPFHQ